MDTFHSYLVIFEAFSAFSAFLHEKRWKSRFQPVFEVCSTHTWVKIYNRFSRLKNLIARHKTNRTKKTSLRFIKIDSIHWIISRYTLFSQDLKSNKVNWIGRHKTKLNVHYLSIAIEVWFVSNGLQLKPIWKSEKFSLE